ncbi:MAG: DUF3617 family protein [Rhizomicrobium sp.]
MNRIAIFVATAFAMQIGAAYAVDLPQIKEGLWQIRTQTVDNPGNKKSQGSVMLCRDHAFDKRAKSLARNVRGCDTSNESFANGKYSAETRCEIGSTVIVSRGTVTFRDDRSTHSEIHVTYTPAFAGNTDETMIQDQTYLGDCPAGMHPGDRRH